MMSPSKRKPKDAAAEGPAMRPPKGLVEPRTRASKRPAFAMEAGVAALRGLVLGRQVGLS